MSARRYRALSPVVLAAAALLVPGPGSGRETPETTKARSAIRQAVADRRRPAADVALDRYRKPARVLEFLGVAPGMKVADLMAGGGYYTEILSRLVGAGGVVYSQNNAIALRRFADRAMSRRLKGDRLPNVVRLDRELEDLGLPAGQIDVVLLVLFYHDTYWMKVDRPKMLAGILRALKPGGRFCVIDHHAATGAGERDVSRLHRGDAAMIKKEIVAAGFQFDGESDLLRNAADDHTLNVFDPRIRRRTDRFVFRFRKPKEGASKRRAGPRQDGARHRRRARF